MQSSTIPLYPYALPTNSSNSCQVISADGTFMTSSYEEGGECVRLAYAKFVRSDGEQDETPGPSKITTSTGSAANSNISPDEAQHDRYISNTVI